MELIERTTDYEIYLDCFMGNTVRIKKDLKTNAISFFAEDVATVLGYESLEGMMGDDNVLDALNDEHKRTGVFPISVVRPS
jgi:prophage antirepressor-like protein